MDESRRWRVPRETRLLWRTWGEESVVFNARSGDTHLLDLLGREALAALEQQSLTCGELAHWLAGRLDVPQDAELEQYVRQLVGQLEELGLLENEMA